MLSFPAAALLLLALQDKPPAPVPEEEVVAVKKGNLTPVLELEATFAPVETAEFKLRMETYAGEMTLVRAAAQGQAVKKGDPILVLERAPIDRLVAAAEVDLRVARATLEKAEAETRLGEKGDALALLQAETAVRDAESVLRAYDEVEGKHLVRQAELLVKYGEDGIRDQEEELDQLEKMYKTEQLTNATAEIVVRRARRGLERARIQLEMTRGEAKVVKEVKQPQQRQVHAFSVENAKRALEGLKIQQALSKVQREAELAKAKAAAALQEDQLARLRRDLEGFTMRAPFDGRVYYGQLQHGAWATADQVAPLLHPGERLQPGQVLLTACGTKTRAVADLPEADYFDVTVDQAATVAPTAMPDRKRAGAVRAKSVAGQTKGNANAFEVAIELQEPFTELLPGMKGKATIQGAELTGVVVVPSKAVSSEGGKHTVKFPPNQFGVSATREVTVGKGDGKMIHVKSGLEAGEKICVPK